MSSGGLRGRSVWTPSPPRPCSSSVYARSRSLRSRRAAAGPCLPASACMRAARKNWRWTLIRSEAAIRASRGSIPSSSSASVERLREDRTSSRAPSPGAPATPRVMRAKIANPGLDRRAHSPTCSARSVARIGSPSGRERIASRELARALGHLVEEEVLLGREVIEDGLLRHAGLGGDLGDRDLVEAALDEQAHGRRRRSAAASRASSSPAGPRPNCNALITVTVIF